METPRRSESRATPFLHPRRSQHAPEPGPVRVVGMNRSSMFGALAVGILLLALAVGNPFLPLPRRAAPGPHATQPDGPTAMPASLSTQAIGSVPLRMTAAPAPAAASRDTGAADSDDSSEFATDLPDPDRIGPCPRAGIAVVRRGIDPLDGRPTWWHADGSMTKRVQQVVRNADDEVLGEMPGYVTLRPR